MRTLNIAYYMNIGRRDNQEDSLFVNGAVLQSESLPAPIIEKTTDQTALFAVCDGVGGHARGEWASKYVCEQLKIKLPIFQPTKETLQTLLKEIQWDIEREEIVNAGTTIAGVLIKGKDVTIFNAGDSRVYKLTREEIKVVSHDHSYVQIEIDKGYLTADEAFTHPYRNVIDFGMGDIFSNDWVSGVKEVFTADDILNANEYYLICSDGVNDVLRDSEIFRILNASPFDKLSAFITLLTKKMSDNFSFILIGSASNNG